jgi:hypothetical protein
MSEPVTFNNTVRSLVTYGLTEIPGVGWLLGALTDVLWPTNGEDIWGMIKNQVEQLIDEKISELVYEQVQEDLVGLQNVIADYEQALKDSSGDPSYISEKYNVALGAFEVSQPHFEAEGYEVLLLPLLAQMANLHLSLLRDGALHGTEWGWTEQDCADTQANLEKQIQGYTDWVNQWYPKGLEQVKLPKSDPHHTAVWAAKNSYIRGMTLGVLDLAFFWPSYDPKTNPDGSNVPKDAREIYSDPIGTADNSTFSVGPAPTDRITALQVWGWDRIDAVKVQTGGVWGPRMGDSSGGANTPPHGWSGDISADNPVVEVDGKAGDILNSMVLKFKDGTTTNELGGNYGGGNPFTWAFDGEVVSSFKIMGISDYYGSADCLVIGFRYEDSY